MRKKKSCASQTIQQCSEMEKAKSCIKKDDRLTLLLLLLLLFCCCLHCMRSVAIEDTVERSAKKCTRSIAFDVWECTNDACKKSDDYLKNKPILISLCKILLSGIQFDLQFSFCFILFYLVFCCRCFCCSFRWLRTRRLLQLLVFVLLSSSSSLSLLQTLCTYFTFEKDHGHFVAI